MTTNARQLAKQIRMMSPEEVDLLKSCVAKLPAHAIVVNIGANVGTSAMAILEAHRSAFVFSIDKRPCPEERQNIVNAKLDHTRVVRVLGDSAVVGRHWPYPVDLLLVDGAHDDAGVQADIDAWVHRVKPGGFILFHDYQHRNLPRLTGIVDRAMEGYERLGQARYLVAFRA